MKRAGLSLIEVMVAIVVLGVVSLGFVSFQGAMVKSSQFERDRTFALQKSVQMMEELKAKVAGNATTVLDDYNQGDTGYSFVLSTEADVSEASALSGNTPMPGASYRFVRQIEVKPLPRDKGARQVTIRVYRAGPGSTPARGKNGDKQVPALATLTNIFKTPPVVVEPSQLYNMYVLRMDGIIPGKWGYGVSSYSNPRWFTGFENTAITYLKTANPGLEIAKTDLNIPAYGRDPWYSPIYNSSSYYDFQDGVGYGIRQPDRVPLNKVYFLLGSGEQNRSWETFAQGPFRLTVTARGASSEGNGTYAPNSYGYDPLAYDFRHPRMRPIADQFNHALRYVEEKEKIEAPSPNNGSPMTLRYLLDQMLEKKRRNVIISNQHGEVFPMIPMRNYSDAARVPREESPSTLLANWGVKAADDDEIKDGADVRLVTHPLNLESNLSDEVNMRVFPHKTEDIDDEPEGNGFKRGIVVLRQLAGNLKSQYGGSGPAQHVRITVMHRHEAKVGLDLLWNREYREVVIWPPSATGYNATLKDKYLVGVTRKDSAGSGYLADDIAIEFKDIPYTHKLLKNEVGLNYYGIDKNVTLYGMHYFPDPYLIPLDNDNNVPSKWPRSTARFSIKFKVNAPQRVEAVTTIGEDPDLRKHKVPNLSRTWTWVGTPAPETERYQLIGDPRHNPYNDVRNARRYNRYFADLRTNAYKADDTQSFNYFPDTANGWGGDKTSGKHEADVPAYFNIWRKALMDSNSMLCHPTGYAYRIVALGAEYGGDTWQKTVEHSTKPFDGKSGKLGEFDEWKYPTVVVDDKNEKDKWYSIPWLGELYPNRRWTDWRDTGNLPSSDYRRVQWKDVKGYQDYIPGWNHSRYVDDWGSQGFFHATTPFTYKQDDEKADKTPVNGKALDQDLNAKLNPDLDTRFGFLLNDGSYGSKPPNEYGITRYTLEPGLVKDEPEYYKMSGGRASMMPFVLRDGNSRVGYFMFNASRAHYSGNNDPGSFMRIYFSGIMQGFMDMAGHQFSGAGTKSATARIKLLPRITIKAPEDDAMIDTSTLQIDWETEWKRWDGKPYSRQYASYTASHSPDVVFLLKYSEDQGKSWKFIDGGDATNVGDKAVYVDSKKLFGNSYTWNLSGMKNRQYQVRIEAYRYDVNNPGTYENDHHSYTQFSFNLAK